MTSTLTPQGTPSAGLSKDKASAIKQKNKARTPTPERRWSHQGTGSTPRQYSPSMPIGRAMEQSSNNDSPSSQTEAGRNASPATYGNRKGGNAGSPQRKNDFRSEYSPMNQQRNSIGESIFNKLRGRQRQITRLAVIVALLIAIGIYYLFRLYRYPYIAPSKALQEASLAQEASIDPMIQAKLDGSVAHGWERPLHATEPLIPVTHAYPSNPEVAAHARPIQLEAGRTGSFRLHSGRTGSDSSSPSGHPATQGHASRLKPIINLMPGSGAEYPAKRKWRLDDPQEPQHLTI